MATIPDSEEIITGFDSVEITTGDSDDCMVHPERIHMKSMGTSRRIDIENILRKELYYFTVGACDPDETLVVITVLLAAGAAGAA